MSNLSDALTELDRQELIYEIATRAYTAKQLAQRYNTDRKDLRLFTEEYREEIEEASRLAKQETSNGDPTPTELGELWISKKQERLTRYQAIANDLYKEAIAGSRDATVLRELRFYMVAAANELGQLLHRGSGESGSDSLSVDIQGVSIEDLK